MSSPNPDPRSIGVKNLEHSLQLDVRYWPFLPPNRLFCFDGMTKYFGKGTIAPAFLILKEVEHHGESVDLSLELMYLRVKVDEGLFRGVRAAILLGGVEASNGLELEQQEEVFSDGVRASTTNAMMSYTSLRYRQSSVPWLWD